MTNIKIYPRCKVCNCSELNPCFNPKYGYSTFYEPTICSFCASEEIKNDPLTVPRIKSTARKAGVKVDDIIAQLKEGKPFEIPDDKTKNTNVKLPQNRVGVKKAPRKTRELEQNMLALGNALTKVRIEALNLSAHQAKLRCDMPNDTVYNVERGASEIRNLLKYCKGLELELRISYINDDLCVRIFKDGNRLYPL